jgi:hypothetical protein
MSRSTDVCFILMLGAACCAGAAAADLPKEGTFTNTLYGYGTFKGSSVGKTRYVNAFEMDGVSVGEGLMNHMTAHCFGMGERLNQMRRSNGRCTLTDIDGDQIAVDSAIDWYPNGAKDYSGNVTFTAGTGKYEGITGGLKEICYNGVFKAAADNAFFSYCTGEGKYKLP